MARTALVALLAVFFVSSGCSVNPATGERQLSLMSEAQEIEIGRANDAQIVQTMGLYPDEAWQEYIQELGARMAAESERPHLPWTFRVVDDPVVNAFALPGGYIYISRGILAHFNSEAELASVVGHEIGHVTGRHGVERVSKAQLAQVGLMGAAIAGGPELRSYLGLAQQGMQLLFLKFGRDDERQADDLGLRYMVKDGYDPSEMPKVFHTLDRVSGAAGSRLPNWLSTHPAPANRATRIAEQVAQLPSQDGRVDREGYLQRIDNLTFGVDPRKGYTVGETFYHPDLAFALDFPPGWQVINRNDAVFAVEPQQQAVVVLTLSQKDSSDAAFREFFQQDGITSGRPFRQNYRYFKATPEVPQGQQATNYLGILGFVPHGNQLFQLLSYTTDNYWSQHDSAMSSSVASFRRLTKKKYLDVQPKRIDLVKLDRAMTLDQFQKRYPSNVSLQELAILNGVEAGEQLARGTLVKRIVGGELPES